MTTAPIEPLHLRRSTFTSVKDLITAIETFIDV